MHVSTSHPITTALVSQTAFGIGAQSLCIAQGTAVVAVKSNHGEFRALFMQHDSPSLVAQSESAEQLFGQELWQVPPQQT